MDGLLAVAAVLDGVRASLLRALLGVRPLRALFVDPRRRIPAASLVAVALSATVALRAPLLSLWLGAGLLGVPHVVSGARHVAVRQPLERVTQACALLGVLVGAAQIAGAGPSSVRAFAALFSVGAAAEVMAAPAPVARRLGLLAAVLVAGTAGVLRPLAFLLVLSHLHAVSSVAWFALRSRRSARGIPWWPLPVAASAVACAGALGLLDPLLPSTLFAPRSALASIVAEATGASLEGASAALLHRALFLYAFGQSLHFAVWLRLVPEVERAAPVPQTFRRALALLRADLGPLALPAVLVCVAAAPAILVGGGRAREIYFALTYAHFGLEAASLARLVARAPATDAAGTTATAPPPSDRSPCLA